MLFNSFKFLIFFPIVTILYFILPHKFRWFMLLTSSCIFYMAFVPKYIFILAFTIFIDFFVGIALEKIDGEKRKLFLIISILSNIGILFVFKYFNFFNSNIVKVADFFHWNYPIESLKIILPIGLSFHTFQSLSYIIEVYKGKQKAERNFGIYALFVMFYPQLVAGPIERPQNLLTQFHERHYFEISRVADGLKMMLWGMIKKVVIADRLALFVNQIYGNPENYYGMPLISATFFFAFQIYCDFSGYSDIAIGAAKVMGFNLMTNFNRPYLSKSIAEFWRRWHISLSTWFKDYVYIPLGGNRCSAPRRYFNLFITFMLSGLWHGANWTYIIWGALNGIYQIISLMTRNIRNKILVFTKLEKVPNIHKSIQIVFTFSLTMFAWIFFRAANIRQAIYIIRNMFVGIFDIRNFEAVIKVAEGIQAFNNEGLILSFVLILFLIIIELLQRNVVIRETIDKRFPHICWLIYYAGIFAVIILGQFSKAQFIYFQF
ncbi:D-alanyl-lipoteichoic acid acyltransferase DltB (MBOAT superfamily) [Ruminiclostridium sufflavum DSM 19573]|uniref:D-alanyl-lipoteichoic acid acyltransferase DltB (MBOAT superfamily) n=1 Tax=Ruminiclostridium sufflavum DSM 19573 TaxID=1121337 RepID=A0A318XNG0_9FIRM|nr:MBOAT family O-acyltransferase [Ruminiclostridium sufflavum]PYG89156.1 D-alanyl-lipoteichoic acid acyltransferase DltB (MBOAT superfamily) [Ruminiclostridium sufflavum DSM 19573]